MPLLSSPDLSAVPVVSTGIAFLKQRKLLTSRHPSLALVSPLGCLFLQQVCFGHLLGAGRREVNGVHLIRKVFLLLSTCLPVLSVKAAGSQTSVRRWRIGVFSGKGKGLAIDDKQKQVAKYGISTELINPTVGAEEKEGRLCPTGNEDCVCL